MAIQELEQRLDELLWMRGKRAISISKVQGHATSADVRSGKVRQHDKQGNDRADALAVAGAAANASDDNNRRAYIEKMAFTMNVQSLMLDILNARKQARRGSLTPSDSTSSSD